MARSSSSVTSGRIRLIGQRAFQASNSSAERKPCGTSSLGPQCSSHRYVEHSTRVGPSPRRARPTAAAAAAGTAGARVPSTSHGGPPPAAPPPPVDLHRRLAVLERRERGPEVVLAEEDHGQPLEHREVEALVPRPLLDGAVAAPRPGDLGPA